MPPTALCRTCSVPVRLAFVTERTLVKDLSARTDGPVTVASQAQTDTANQYLADNWAKAIG